MLFIKKAILNLTVGVFLLTGSAIAQQEEVTVHDSRSLEDIQELIHTLSQSTSEESTARLRHEAEALRQSRDEKKVILAANIYQTHLEDAGTANVIRREIVAKYPDGLSVRNNEYNGIVLSRENDLSLLERKHEEWLKRFPPENFAEEDQDVYGYIHLHFSQKFNSVENFERSFYHVQKLQGSKYYIASVSSYYNALKDKTDPSAMALVEDAYGVAVSYARSTDEKIMNNNVEPLKAISGSYARVLYDQGQYEQVVQVVHQLLQSVEYSGYYATTHVKTLLDAYSKLGKTQERLDLYERLFVAEGVQEDLLEDATTTYSELYGSAAGFASWIADVESQNKLVLFAKYQAEMVHKEASAFHLKDHSGKNVSLADYKGKVVILDFWATWCLPCIASFPGMQAAVDKYKDDPEVVFLFIDTWQREDNYEELVADFMTENQYDFHVLFDEMKDQNKSTVTAYGVNSIPTKIIIDKHGFICFENSGSETDVNKLVRELDTMIALARSR